MIKEFNSITNFDITDISTNQSKYDIYIFDTSELHLEKYSELIDLIINSKPFMFDFGGNIKNIKANLINKLYELELKIHADKINLFIDDVLCLFNILNIILPDARLTGSLRNWFAPGDTAIHVDRTNDNYAFRLLWAIGRKSGMLFTSSDNINRTLYEAYMKREHPILCKLDRVIFLEKKTLAEAWQHRPNQVQELENSNFPYIINKDLIYEVPLNSLSIHYFESYYNRGTYHGNSTKNSNSPGLQIILSAIKK